MRILVMNVNTTSSMTAAMCAAASAVAAPGTEIIATEPRFGPASVEGYYESYISAAAILDRLATWDGPSFDALVWAGFGEHGREGAQELLDVPVITITEAAAMTACLVGHKYGVVTTLRRAVPQIEDQLRLAGLLDRCAAILAADLGVLELEEDLERTTARLVEVGRAAIAAGAEALCLGCGGMAGMSQRLSAAARGAGDRRGGGRGEARRGVARSGSAHEQDQRVRRSRCPRTDPAGRSPGADCRHSSDGRLRGDARRIRVCAGVRGRQREEHRGGCSGEEHGQHDGRVVRDAIDHHAGHRRTDEPADRRGRVQRTEDRAEVDVSRRTRRSPRGTRR